VALGINDAGQVVRYTASTPQAISEPSTWAMLPIGFAGLALADYRRAKACAQLWRARVRTGTGPRRNERGGQHDREGMARLDDGS
jgi:hypothetical protein